MFFVDASELGDEFFDAQSELPPIPAETPEVLAPGFDSPAITHQLRRFREWGFDVFVPLFNAANPHRELDVDDLIATRGLTTGENCDVHLDDYEGPRDYTYLTIGILANGRPSNTLTARRLKCGVRYTRVQRMGQEEIEREFVTPSSRLATVFDPDRRWHAEPAPVSEREPINRRRWLYKIRTNAYVRRDPADTRPIRVPEHPLCSVPEGVELESWPEE
jgi:hypothetical protein